MKKNLEAKFILNDFQNVKSAIEGSGRFKVSVETQRDVYFKSASGGKLKLRIINGQTGNLIFYKRNDSVKTRTSEYLISSTEDFRQLELILRGQLRVLSVVEKVREIYISRNIRIHLDKVKRLGKFLEIEIIYTNLNQARKQMKELLSMLSLNANDGLQNSYFGLINKKR